MKHARILMLTAAVLALTACDASGPAGAPRLEPPPAGAMRVCRHPTEFLPPPGSGDWEIIAGRIGDELLRCRAEKQVLATWAAGVSAAINARADKR
ncbi:hypothetical protein GCM10017056_01030 [Seohaeicola zhoushanensis]|uniref:Uncharacterized protein n=2 Tax=Seohaeicola zhoushanensis TaxID=1569283 RepID=A0A8J3GTK8_9RHOB|nr:hypothetical protein GCM10017056_01030 [Seohaeicola zhoushanensis]